MGTFYISDATPAQHCGPAQMQMLEQGAPLGADPLLQSDATDLFGEWEKKGDYYARGAAYWQLLSSAGLCALYAQFDTPPVVELLRPVTGWDIDWAEGLKAGRRILTLRQAFNYREGLTPDAYRLPKTVSRGTTCPSPSLGSSTTGRWGGIRRPAGRCPRRLPTSVSTWSCRSRCRCFILVPPRW